MSSLGGGAVKFKEHKSARLNIMCSIVSTDSTQEILKKDKGNLVSISWHRYGKKGMKEQELASLRESSLQDLKILYQVHLAEISATNMTIYGICAVSCISV